MVYVTINFKGVLSSLLSLPLLAALLLPGSHDPVILTSSDLGQELNHFDLAPEGAMAATEWIGLYDGPDGPRLEAARVDIALREHGDRLDFEIRSEPGDAQLLFSGFPQLSPGPASTAGWNVSLDSWDGSAGVSAVFQLGGEEYTVGMRSIDPLRCDAVVVLEHGDRTQRLFDMDGASDTAIGPQFGCDEPHFHVHWAGDLDGDGRLDLLVTFSGKYSFHPRQLLLSSAAPHSALVALAGTYDPY